MGRRSLWLLAAAAAPALAALFACCDSASASWLLAQLLGSICPWRVSVAHELEEWAFARWEAADRPLLPSVPMPVPEVSATATSLDFQRPFIVRGLLNGTAAMDSHDWLSALPVGGLEVPFYSNASNGMLRPDSVGLLGDVARAIQAGGPQKLATELPFRRYPELLEKLTPPLARLFGSAPFESWRLGKVLTVPLFMGTGADGAAVRTDLHAEPVASATLALAGSKRWTLVPTSQSHLLRPSVTADGRAFFVTRRAHGADGQRAIAESGAAHYEVEQFAGDVLWVPTWTWHRVDYYPGVTALSVSLFHLRAGQFFGDNTLFAAGLMPNMLKELIGWKTQ